MGFDPDVRGGHARRPAGAAVPGLCRRPVFPAGVRQGGGQVGRRGASDLLHGPAATGAAGGRSCLGIGGPVGPELQAAVRRLLRGRDFGLCIF